MAEIVINIRFATEMYTLVYLLTGAQIAGCYWIKTLENMYRRLIRMMHLHTLGRWWTGKRQVSRMNNDIQIFNSEEFGDIRTVTVNNEPMFCLLDVCKALDIKNTTDVAKRLDADEVTRLNLGGKSGETNFVNESGLYAVILRSDKPNARKFRKWVTADVLPTIRKTGGYQMAQPQGKELLALAVLEAQKTIEQQNKEIDRMRPKEIFADAVSSSHTSILIGELAKILKQNGVDTGQRRLFEWLRRNGYLIRRNGSDYNMPTQRSMEMKLFEIKESTAINPDGSTRINRTPKVTGKGQAYFINKFLDYKGELAG